MGTAQEVRTMVANLTNRLNELQSKPHFGRAFHRRDNEDDEHGQSIVNLAGNNSGAVMKAELEEGTKTIGDGGEDEMKGTYVNSNFQAVNNSIFLGGSYTSEDPGVHMEVRDYQMEHGGYILMEEKKIKKIKKIKKKENADDEEYERATKSAWLSSFIYFHVM